MSREIKREDTPGLAPGCDDVDRRCDELNRCAAQVAKRLSAVVSTITTLKGMTSVTMAKSL